MAVPIVPTEPKAYDPGASDKGAERRRTAQERRLTCVQRNVHPCARPASLLDREASPRRLAVNESHVDVLRSACSRVDLREILGSNVDLSRVMDWRAKGYDPGMDREVVRDLRRRKSALRR